MSKHTPGPWKIHDGGRFGQYGDLGPSICHPTSKTTCQPLFEIVGPANIEECQANAALIAAAPELLEALQMLARSYPRTQTQHQTDMLLQSMAAIAKATGGKP